MERILIALCAAFIMMHFQPKSTNHKLIFIVLVMVFAYLITRNVQHSVVIGLNAYLAHAIATEHLPKLLKREGFTSKTEEFKKSSKDYDSESEEEYSETSSVSSESEYSDSSSGYDSESSEE